MATERPPDEGRWTERVSTAGAHAWPSVRLSPAVLRDAANTWPSLVHAWVDAPCEIYIALACLHGDAAAMRAFEARYFESAAPALATFLLSPDELAELRQRLRVRLFVQRRASLPVILHYAGQGKLGGLVRVAMIREAIRLRPRSSPAAIEDVPIAGYDPDLRFLDEDRRQLAKEALQAAARTLSARDRALLRLHHVRDVSGARLAQMYGVHRATVSRWLDAARHRMLAAFQAELRARLPDLPEFERDRFATWFTSRIELSLERMFATGE